MHTTSSSFDISAANNSGRALTLSSPQIEASFAILDFIKMLAASLLSGLVVSAFIIALTLVLAGNADAGTSQKSATMYPISSRPLQDAPIRLKPTAGGLFISDGCDRESVDVVERDWKVTITYNTAAVRVMQTFLLPANGPTVAFFETTLPPNAKLLGFKAHMPEKILSGKMLATHDFIGMNRQQLIKFRRQDALIIWNKGDTFSTDQIMNLIPNETVVIEYTYLISTHLENGLHELNLVLNGYEREMFVASKPNMASGTVCVEWLGAKAKRMINTPATVQNEVALEESAQGISGLSWFTPDLAADTTMKFTWEMNSSLANTRTANR